MIAKEERHSITDMFVIACSMDRNAAIAIENEFNKNKELYLDNCIKYNYVKHGLKSIFSMETEDIINKLYGIVIESKKTKDFSTLERIAKAIHPSIPNYIKNCNIFSIDYFIEKYVSKEDYTDEKLFSIVTTLSYLEDKNKKRKIGDHFSYMLKKSGFYINKIPKKILMEIYYMINHIHLMKI